jgi:hypothetical protein
VTWLVVIALMSALGALMSGLGALLNRRNGKALQEIHVLVNSRLSEALAKILELENKVIKLGGS